MKVSNQIVTHELRPKLTSSYFVTWKRSLVPRPMGEHLVRVCPHEGHCSSLPVRGYVLKDTVLVCRWGYVLKKDTVPVCRWGYVLKKDTVPVCRWGYVLKKDTVPVCQWEGTSSRRTLFQFAGERVRPQGHCSSLPPTDLSSQPITSITVLQATYVGPLPIQ